MSHATENDLKPYTLWEDNERRQAVITRVDDRLVEYGFATQEAVYYLEKGNFLRNFNLVTSNSRPLTAAARTQLMGQLESCLRSLKERGLGDNVYAIMDEMGL